MWLFLLGEEPIPKSWWCEFVDAWGNTASIVGLMVSLIAFPLTWTFQAKIRLANQEAVRRVALVLLGVFVEDLHRHLTAAREAGRLGLWLRVFDRCHDARHQALRLVGNPHLTQPEKDALRSSADDLTQVIRYVEMNKLGQDPSSAFQQDKKAIIDTMVTLLTNIQGRLGTRTWEV